MQRVRYLQSIARGFNNHRIVALLGPRQCGKTTLAKEYSAGVTNFAKRNYFDLEKPQDLERLQNPYLALSALSGLIVIDEVQRSPDLFPVLRVLHDEFPNLQFLILGSASRDLLRQSSESLAGRIYYQEITPFYLQEVDDWQKLWQRGGFPKSYLAQDLQGSIDWRKNYIKTFLEQDIPNLGVHLPFQSLHRFWMMLTHFHGQIFNGSQIGQSLEISQQTARRYLDILSDTLMLRILSPWYTNLGKRYVKSPKVYFRDSGIFHTLSRMETQDDFMLSPLLGASFEGFALEEVIRYLQVDQNDCYFWATHGGAELDLFVQYGKYRLGFEFKYADRPSMTKSMRTAFEELNLNHLYIVHPGSVSWPVQEKVDVVGIDDLRACSKIN